MCRVIWKTFLLRIRIYTFEFFLKMVLKMVQVYFCFYNNFIILYRIIDFPKLILYCFWKTKYIYTHTKFMACKNINRILESRNLNYTSSKVGFRVFYEYWIRANSQIFERIKSIYWKQKSEYAWNIFLEIMLIIYYWLKWIIVQECTMKIAIRVNTNRSHNLNNYMSTDRNVSLPNASSFGFTFRLITYTSPTTITSYLLLFLSFNF